MPFKDPKRRQQASDDWRDRNREHVNAMKRARRAERPDAYDPAAQAVRSRRHKYGVEPADYARMLESCGHRCEICGVELVGDTKATTPHSDHDHATGAARGILCDRHNKLLGFAADDVSVLLAAAEYLQRTTPALTA